LGFETLCIASVGTAVLHAMPGATRNGLEKSLRGCKVSLEVGEYLKLELTQEDHDHDEIEGCIKRTISEHGPGRVQVEAG